MSDIEQKLKDYLISSGATNEWYDEEENEDIGEDLVHCFLNDDLDTPPNDNRLEHIYQKGGGEGEGEHVEAVLKFDDVFYKATWHYYSHHGMEYESLNFTEVVPVEKTITVYEEA